MRKWKAAGMLACCALAANLAAQEEGRRERRADDRQPPQGQVEVGQGGVQVDARGQREGRGMRRGPMAIGDRDLAMCLVIGNKGEVEMSTWIKDKLTNEQSKQFAEMLIKDHSAALEKLNAFTSGRPGQPPAGNAAAQPGAEPQPGAIPPQPTPLEPAQPGGVRVTAGAVDVQVVGQQPGQGRSFYAPGTSPFVALKQEIARECMALAKKEFEQKQGVDVDKCFVGGTIGGHMHAIATLTVFQRHAQDSQFKEFCGTALQTTQHHLEMAKKLMKELEGKKAE